VKAFRCQKKNIIHAEPTAHSRKPEAFWELIEPVLDQHGIGPRIELFARTRRAGWDAWGNEAPA
jgi:N6-adenosine-specific RNA methylase IME4